MATIFDSMNDFLSRPLSLDNFGSKAIYNSNGVQIGYYDTLSDLANGVIHYTLKAGASVDAPSTWLMNGGPFAIRQPVAKYLVSQGIIPTWKMPDSIVPTVQAQNTPFGWDTFGNDLQAGVTGLIPNIDLGFSTPSIDATKLGTYAVWGGLGLLGLIVVLKKA